MGKYIIHTWILWLLFCIGWYNWIMRNDNGQEMESPMTSQAGVSYVYFDYTLSMICQVSSTDIFWMFFDGDLKLFDIWFDMWTHILIKPFPAKILTFIERCLNDWYQRYLNCRLNKDNVTKVIRWKDIMILICIYIYINDLFLHRSFIWLRMWTPFWSCFSHVFLSRWISGVRRIQCKLGWDGIKC